MLPIQLLILFSVVIGILVGLLIATGLFFYLRKPPVQKKISRSKSWDSTILDASPTGTESVPASLALPSIKQSVSYVTEIDAAQIEVSPDFEKTFHSIESTNDCFIITGKAGTGKSTFLRYFATHTKKKIVILAPTGVAALNVGGQTIHSFFHFPPRPMTEEDIRVHADQEIYKLVDTIVIDEISMVRADLLDAVDRFMRLNGRSYEKPFGGAQIVCFGDPYQLPPIVKKGEAELFGTYYQSAWFFDGHVFENIQLHVVEFSHVYRHTDPQFRSFLDDIRMGIVTSEQLGFVNRICTQNSTPGDHIITLVPTNQLANNINETRLAALPPPEFHYQGVLEGDFPQDALPVPSSLLLKKGAQVMFAKNDISRRWVNGTIGHIVELTEDRIQVAVENDGQAYTYPVGKEKWEMYRYKFQPATLNIKAEVVGAYTQYPLRLAWAITIHKSQGLTFEYVKIDIGSGSFANGQTYVALSRCRTLEGMSFQRAISKTDIKVDTRVADFFRTVSQTGIWQKSPTMKQTRLF